MINEKKINFQEKSLKGKQNFKELEEKFKELNYDYRRTDLEDELLEIYEDEDGNIIDVKKIDIKKTRPGLKVMRQVFLALFFFCLLLSAVYLYFFQFKKNSSELLVLEVTAPTETVSGADVFYTLKYRNSSSVALRDIQIAVHYPESFVFEESFPAPDSYNNSWNISSLALKGEGEIKIKGKIINEEGSFNQFDFKANYFWAGFSTQFKSQKLTATLIKGLGIEASLDYSRSVLLGETSEAILSFKNNRSNYKELELFLYFPEGFSLEDVMSKTGSKISVKELSDNSFKIFGLDADGDQFLSIKYKVQNLENKEFPRVELALRAPDNQSYVFFKKELSLEAVNSDLSLLLSVNGQAGDKAVDFGDLLEYSIKYYNRGQASVKDLTILINIESPFVSWESLKDKNYGERRGNSMIWTKSQIPDLAELAPGQEGWVNFSLKLNNYQSSDFAKKMTVTSRAEFSVSGQEASEANRSNQVINKINSDLSFTEKILYFDENNNPVGSGPLPPQVSQATSYRVYWELKNSLHELSDVILEFSLPNGVEYAGRSQNSIGYIDYDNESRKVRWQIPALNTSIPVSNSQFDIKINPQEGDRGKIMVLSAGSALRAFDTETQSYFGRQGGAKTTRLEDDDIASLNNDGVVK